MVANLCILISFCYFVRGKVAWSSSCCCFGWQELSKVSFLLSRFLLLRLWPLCAVQKRNCIVCMFIQFVFPCSFCVISLFYFFCCYYDPIARTSKCVLPVVSFFGWSLLSLSSSNSLWLTNWPAYLYASISSQVSSGLPKLYSLIYLWLRYFLDLCRPIAFIWKWIHLGSLASNLCTCEHLFQSCNWTIAMLLIRLSD
jgi:hypothetical protein